MGFFSELLGLVSSAGQTSTLAISNATCPLVAQGVPAADPEPESVSPFTPPPHVSFRLIWCVSLITGSVISKCVGGGALERVVRAVEKQISFEPPHGEIKQPVGVGGGAEARGGAPILFPAAAVRPR